MNIEELKEISKSDKFSGIYAIYNTNSKKVYIGSSVNIYKRVYNDHVRLLKQGKHNNKYLQSAYEKDFDNFSFFVVEETTNSDTQSLKNTLLKREQYWMDSFKSFDREYGYNINRKADSPLGYKHSKESKLKISNSQKGKKMSNETKEKIREANSGEKGFWFGKKFSEEHRGNLSVKRKMYKPTEETKNKISSSMSGNKISQKNREINRVRKSKPILQFSKTGEFIKEWFCARDIERELNLSHGNISQCCQGKRKTVGGFVWKFKEEEVRA